MRKNALRALLVVGAGLLAGGTRGDSVREKLIGGVLHCGPRLAFILGAGWAVRAILDAQTYPVSKLALLVMGGLAAMVWGEMSDDSR